MCAEFVHCGYVLHMVLGHFTKLCIHFLVTSQLKIILVQSGWIKHPPPPLTHTQTNELAVISLGKN